MYLSRIDIRTQDFPGNDVYPFTIPVLKGPSTLVLDTPVTFFIGENGSGKSTLLRALAKKCNIHIWKGLERQRTTYNACEHLLHKYIDIQWSNGSTQGSFFDSEVFKNFAQILDDWARSDPGLLGYFGGASLLTKSHGQCNMTFFENRFTIPGIYLLDEPESALSPKRQIDFLHLLRKTSENGIAQFIISTHSPIILAYPDARIYNFDGNTFNTQQYEETELYETYCDFLRNKDRYLKRRN